MSLRPLDKLSRGREWTSERVVCGVKAECRSTTRMESRTTKECELLKHAIANEPSEELNRVVALLK